MAGKNMQAAAKTLKQALLYTSVGGTATLVDWAFFWLFTARLHVFYLLANALAFLISTFVNWLCGRLFLFRHAERSSSLALEIAKVYLTNLVGLLLNLGILWVTVEKLAFAPMGAKILATFLVFFWNFSIRKLVIYKI